MSTSMVGTDQSPGGVDRGLDPDGDLALAADLVRSAGRLALRMRAQGVESERKTSVSDIVTAADKAAERLVVERLAAARPDDGLVGEEGSASPGVRTWFIDPVDGTYNYASCIPLWCSAVALTDSAGPVLGAVYDAVRDELWLGGRDHPTTCNGVPVPVVADRPLDQISVAYYLHPTTLPDDRVREPLLRALTPAATVRSLGSGSIELSWIAGGRLGAYVQYDCLPWDWLPGAAIVSAAGLQARVVEHDGRRWHLAGPARALDQLASALSR